MRIARFDLTAFGHFTDTTLPFPAGPTDMHVVHGPNEAGKSTLRVALLDWFYGIHGQTPYGFLHGYPKLQIGGRIEDPTLGALEFLRFKRIKNPLVNADGTPLAEQELARWLLRLDRESYKRMYAIDHEQLLAGEGAITDAGSDIGRILFGAAAGLSNLSEVRAKIEAEADELWGQRKRNQHQFVQADKLFGEAKETLDAVSLSAAKYRAAKAALDEALGAEQKVEEQLGTLTTRRGQLQRVARVAAPYARWNDAVTQREALGIPVAFPDGADTTFAGADTTLANVKVREAALRQSIKEQTVERDGIVLTPALTDHAEDMRARHGKLELVAKAKADLPSVQRDLTEVVESIGRAARHLNWGDTSVEALAAPGRLPSPIKRTDLHAHLKLYTGLVNKRDIAQSDHETKEGEVNRLTEQLMNAAEATDLPALNVAISAGRALNYAQAVTEAQRAITQAQGQLAKARRALAPWTGTDEELAGPDFPTVAEATELLAERNGAAGSRQNTADQLDREDTALVLATQALNAHNRERTAVTPEAVQEHRAERDRLWRDIRGGAPLATAAEPFEGAMRQADGAADRCYEDAAFTAEQRKLVSTQEERQLARDATKSRLDGEDRKLHALDERWSRRVAFIELARYVEWAAKGATALATMEALQQANQAKDELLDRAKGVAARLRAACAAATDACDEADFTVLLAHAEVVQRTRADERVKQDGWRTSLAEQKVALNTAKRRLDTAQEALDAWAEQRDKLLDGVGIARDTGNDGAETALELLQTLGQALGEHKKLAKRVQDMENEIEEFASAATALAQACATDLLQASPEDVVWQLDERLRAEEQFAAHHQRLTDSITRDEDVLAELEGERIEAEASIASLLALAKVATVDSLRTAIDLWTQCRDGDRLVAELRDAVVDTGDGLPFDTLAAEVKAEDLTALAGALEAVEHKIVEAGKARTTAVEKRTNAQNHFNQYAGQDAAVRAEAKRQDALLLMREAAEGYFRQAISARLLGWATKRFAERKHEPLLNRASLIFSQLTLGNFSKLALGEHGEQTRLFAYRPDGTHILFGAGLSTGTEAELYLALRLASLEQHIEAGNVLPFLGDDLMVGWDEERAAAGTRVLADLARKTQVILLTHSAAVRDIAKNQLGDLVSITSLPRNLAKAA